MNKLLLLVGTRPEAIKLLPVYMEARKQGLDVKLISTGQHKQMLEQVFNWFQVKPDISLDVMTENQTLTNLTAQILQKLDPVISSFSNSVLLVQGDTTSAMAGAMVAFYHKIPVAHVEAGLRTYNKHAPWPEEVNRNIISKIADIHFAPTSWSANNILNENIPASSIYVTGNTVIDALLYSLDRVEHNQIFPEALSDYFSGDKKNHRVILITGHRRENWGDGFASVCRAIVSLATHNPSVAFIYPVHLNPNVKDVVYRELAHMPNVVLLPPLDYAGFISLMNRSYLILTDSGGVQEEAPSLGKPVLVMRETTERPEGVEAGTVKLVGTHEQNIIDAVQELLDDENKYKEMSNVKNPYGDGTASKQIITVLKDIYASST